jgi:hypothetical protein
MVFQRQMLYSIEICFVTSSLYISQKDFPLSEKRGIYRVSPGLAYYIILKIKLKCFPLLWQIWGLPKN